jgi:hypothetical protein
MSVEKAQVLSKVSNQILIQAVSQIQKALCEFPHSCTSISSLILQLGFHRVRTGNMCAFRGLLQRSVASIIGLLF